MHGSSNTLDLFNSSNQPDFGYSCYAHHANAECPEANYSANVFTEKAIDVLRAVAPAADAANGADRRPFFLYLAYQSVRRRLAEGGC